MKICIFCGASSSRDTEVEVQVKKVMKAFYDNGIELVYGGASIGIMGSLANELINLGGRVTGVIPQQLLNKEVGHAGLTKLHVVKDMHERKHLMYKISDAFLIFPGGMGTLDELFEIMTWKQLGLHSKPITIFNINGYFDSLITFMDNAIDKGLIKEDDRKLIKYASNWEDLWTYIGENSDG